MDWCCCMVGWSNCMVDSWCNMEGSVVVRDRHRMDGGGVVEGGSMMSNSMVNRGSMSNSMMDRSSMVSNSMVDGSNCMVGNSMVNGSNSMVSNSMVGYRMVGNCMVGVRVSNHRRWDDVPVLVEDGFGKVGVEQGVCVETVEGDGCTAVHCVPELAPEQVLIEKCSVGADEASSLRSVPSVVTNPIGLTSGLRVSVHAGGEGDAGTAKLSVGRVSMAGVVDAGMTNCTMLIVLWLMVGLWGVVGCRCHHRGMIRWRCWFMVGWRRGRIRGRLMIGWRWGSIWCRLMVSWGRWGIRCWLMV